MELSDLDKQVLTRIQADFPIEPRPYAVLGEHVGADEADVLAAVDKLRAEGVIRRIGAIFDSHRLGYRSTLCAIAAPEDRVDEVAATISAYPNVTHNYLRVDRYNIWFTLIASSQERISAILREIAETTGIDDILDLPAIRLFKIRVEFDLTGEGASASRAPRMTKPADTQAVALTADEKELAILLQDDLPRSETPFLELHEMLEQRGIDVSEQWVLDRTREWVGNGVIRRFGAAIRHHKTGFTANAMGVWTCPEDRVEEVGTIMAGFAEVSHCYQRPSAPTWPANLYTMIHGRSPEDVEGTAERIRAAVGLPEPRLLYSIREFKKTSMTYFAEDER
jgi:DNA-binding Lrp family transcriptional regulator